MPSSFQQEEGVVPLGPYTAWATPAGQLAQVRAADGTVVQRFSGETAWSDAVREAGDRNAHFQYRRSA